MVGLKRTELRTRLWEDANFLHRQFVDLMHVGFGQVSHPGYARIRLDNRFILGTAIRLRPLYKDRIHLSVNYIEEYASNKDYTRFLFTCAHESAHLMHEKLIEWPRINNELSLSRNWFAEDVAEYASLVFFNKFGKDSLDDALQIADKESPAARLFLADPTLITTLSNLDVEEYQKLFWFKTNESIDYLAEETKRMCG